MYKERFPLKLTVRIKVSHNLKLISNNCFLLLLHSYQKPLGTFPLLSEAFVPEFYPTSIVKIEDYIFKLGVEEFLFLR